LAQIADWINTWGVFYFLKTFLFGALVFPQNFGTA